MTLASGADAHGGDPVEVHPVLDPLPAALDGMRVELRETLGAQLVLENPTPRSVEVLDENQMPFLRIGPTGVEANLAAAAWYRTLGPASAVPPSLSPAAEARWVRASARPSYGWFDARLAANAGALRGAAHEAGEFGRWEVPLRVDGDAVALSGRFRATLPSTGSYSARLTSPSEISPGVRVKLLPGRAPGLLVENTSERTLLVFGAEGEPFLRIGPEGVDANLRSQTWQRSARSASAPQVEIAAVGEQASAPAWRRVASLPRFAWIEPRALVSSAPPVTPRDGAPTDVLMWRIPMQLGDQPLLLTGVTSWRPSEGQLAHTHSEP